jgi:hypothetical protein
MAARTIPRPDGSGAITGIVKPESVVKTTESGGRTLPAAS